MGYEKGAYLCSQVSPIPHINATLQVPAALLITSACRKDTLWR